MTRTSARTDIRALLGAPDDGTANVRPANSEINEWIDQAVIDITTRTHCYEYFVSTGFATVSGTDNYAFPSTIGATAVVTLAVKALIVTSSKTTSALRKVPPERIGHEEGVGPFYKWTEWADNIFITPTPTAAFTIKPLVCLVGGCTTAGAIGGIPTEYHHLIPLYGLYKGLQNKGDYGRATTVYQSYNQNLESTYQRVTRRNEQIVSLPETKDAHVIT
ncbi:MAG: hypothetical protein SV062_08040 [Thermodesulfobacteriota bacterium]|nr:hypothetical protein [Thermodesulfobacteriota bacterium]